jgi:hypothetical protein
VEDQVFGLICIDDTDAVRGWDAADLGYFDQFITEFFSPIIRATGSRSRRYWRNSRRRKSPWRGWLHAA